MTTTATEPPERVQTPDVLPVLPVERALVLPGMLGPIMVAEPALVRLVDDAMRANRMLAVMKRRGQDEGAGKSGPTGRDELNRIGTAAFIQQLFRPQGGPLRIVVQGTARIRLLDVIRSEPYILARIEKAPELDGAGLEIEALARTVREVFLTLLPLSPELPDELASVVAPVTDPLQLAYLIASISALSGDAKQEILELDPIDQKLRRLLELLQHELAVRRLGHEIASQTQEKMSKEQRDYVLREQLRTIQQQLGESDPERAEARELQRRLAEVSLPEELRREIDRELARFERLPPSSPEHGMIRTYIDWIASLPWQRRTGSPIDIAHARAVLDEDHYDLEEIKDRILDHLAVKKLREERRLEMSAAPRVDVAGAASGTDDVLPLEAGRRGAAISTPADELAREPILCLVGPPGVGKTSLGQSIARAMGRRFVRISLGGVHDEAEIRGHRRTYIGAMPGRIIQALRRAESADPVFMLDEVDKLGVGIQGDPAAALLEVLDPAQNHAFVDTYLGVPFDLSQVMFICTANSIDTIPAPLLDRMEVVRLSGYTDTEKVEIARRHLMPKLAATHGLRPGEVELSDAAIRAAIRQYTREAGVRGLERELAVAFRKAARQISESTPAPIRIGPGEVARYLGRPRFYDEVAERTDRPGVAIGLAWTPVGGDVLFVEATFLDSPEDKLILTGMLGNVMQESAQAALSCLRANGARIGLGAESFAHKAIHVHVPAGAVPKDGPSAGVTIMTALASAATGRPVRSHLAMTGEITLRGKILPVGGIRDKVLAAHRAGITTVLLPRRNERDLEDVPAEVRQALRFDLVDAAGEVLELALTPLAAPAPEHTAPAVAEGRPDLRA